MVLQLYSHFHLHEPNGITQPKSGHGLRSGLEKGGFVCSVKTGLGQVRGRNHMDIKKCQVGAEQRGRTWLWGPRPRSKQALPHTSTVHALQNQLRKQESSVISSMLTVTRRLSPPSCITLYLLFVPIPSRLLPFAFFVSQS